MPYSASSAFLYDRAQSRLFLFCELSMKFYTSESKVCYSDTKSVSTCANGLGLK